MALVDKHKVKRQRLDRICEGEAPLLLSFSSLCLYTCGLEMLATHVYWKSVISFVGCLCLSHCVCVCIISKGLYCNHKKKFPSTTATNSVKSQLHRLHKCVYVCQKGILGPDEAPNFSFKGCLDRRMSVSLFLYLGC